MTDANVKELLERLRRGELIGLMADVDCDRIDPTDFCEALHRYLDGGWLRRLLRFFIGR